MNNVFYGQLDLTKIAALVQQQPELVKYATFRDGEHMLLPPCSKFSTSTTKARASSPARNHCAKRPSNASMPDSSSSWLTGKTTSS